MKRIHAWLDIHFLVIFITLNMTLLANVIEWVGNVSGHIAIAKGIGFIWFMICIGLILGRQAITFMKGRTLLSWPILLPRLALFLLLIWMTFSVTADQVNPWAEHLVIGLLGCCAFILSMPFSDRWHKLWGNLQRKTIERIAVRKKNAKLSNT